MANISPTTAAIKSIAQYLSHAAEAARSLDMTAAEDLRSLLRISSCEAERVRKASRKANAVRKPAGKPAKGRAKNVRAVAAKVAAQPVRGRRRGAVANGVAH